MAMTAILAGTDVTSRCMTLARTEKLNRPWTGEISLAAQYASFTEGVDELVIVDGGTDKAVGPAYYGEDSGDADNVFSTIRCNSPDEFFDRRQVMDPDGDYSDPSIFEDNLNAVDIFAAALTNSIANDGAFGIATGSTAGGGVTLVGYRPVDWPMTLADLRTLLVDTGELDVVLQPAAGGASTVDLYNGDYGADLSGSVSLDYATGAYNCSAAKLTWDMASVITRIRYLLGPKRPQYDYDVQHWAADVQKDDPNLPDPPQTAIAALIAAGESAWGLLREVRIYDANGDEDALRSLYYRLWQSEMAVRLTPRKLLTMTPKAGLAPTFGIGDRIAVNAALRGMVSGTQRVYEMRVEQDTEGNQTITQVVTSADQDI